MIRGAFLLLLFGMMAAEALAVIPPSLRTWEPPRAPSSGRSSAGAPAWPLSRLADSVLKGAWDTRFDPPGPDGEVYAVARLGTDIYIGGDFQRIGNVRANHIARWDGRAWHSLGDGPTNGVSRLVTALFADGDSLFVGGQFDEAGDLRVNNLAVWRPASRSWAKVGSGLSGDDNSVVTTFLRNGKNLYVGGRFSSASTLLANNIACWDGSRWSRLSSGVNGIVAALAVSQDRFLYVGGLFTTAGTTKVRNLAVWDVQLAAWSDVGGGGTDSIVGALAVRDRNVYVGGRFYEAGGVAVNQLAIYNEASRNWSPFPLKISRPPFGDGGYDPATVYDLEIDGPILYVGGILRMGRELGVFFTDSASGVLRWNLDRNGLEPVGLGVVNFNNETMPKVNDLRLADGMLYVGGAFTMAGSYEAPNVAAMRLSDARWVSFGPGVDGTSGKLDTGRTPAPRDPFGLRAMLVSGNDVYVGGYISSAAGVPSRNIIRWDGSQWHPLGDGVGDMIRDRVDFEYPDHVNAIARMGSDLIVGGSFTVASGLPVGNIARWNGTAWSAMGSTASPVFNGVTSLAMIGGQLYAAGVVPGPLGRVARWNGSDFELIGTFDDSVHVIAEVDGKLYAGGAFDSVGGASAPYLAVYDPATGLWSPAGVELDGAVRAMVADRGRLYVGGGFMHVNGADAALMAQWDGEVWSGMGHDLRGSSAFYRANVYALAMHEGRLYVGGGFSPNEESTVAYLGMWDGSSWVQVDGGMDNRVMALASQDDRLLVAGDFTQAGSVQAHYFTRFKVGAEQSRVIAGLAEVMTAVRLGEPVPNPATGLVSVSLELGSAMQVRAELYDALGRRVAALADGRREAGQATIEAEVGELPAGMYLIRVTTPSGVSTRSIAVAR